MLSRLFSDQGPLANHNYLDTSDQLAGATSLASTNAAQAGSPTRSVSPAVSAASTSSPMQPGPGPETANAANGGTPGSLSVASGGSPTADARSDASQPGTADLGHVPSSRGPEEAEMLSPDEAEMLSSGESAAARDLLAAQLREAADIVPPLDFPAHHISMGPFHAHEEDASVSTSSPDDFRSLSSAVSESAESLPGSFGSDNALGCAGRTSVSSSESFQRAPRVREASGALSPGIWKCLSCIGLKHLQLLARCPILSKHCQACLQYWPALAKIGASLCTECISLLLQVINFCFTNASLLHGHFTGRSHVVRGAPFQLPSFQRFPAPVACLNALWPRSLRHGFMHY